MPRCDGDTQPYTVSLCGYIYSRREAKRLAKQWEVFMERSRARTAAYEALSEEKKQQIRLQHLKQKAT